MYTDIYNINQLDAMLSVRDAWLDLPESVIENCWKNTKYLPLVASGNTVDYALYYLVDSENYLRE